jgi:hypothetical protein
LAGHEKLKDAFASWGHEQTGIEREESGWKVDSMNLLYVLYNDLDPARVGEPVDRQQLAEVMYRHGYRIEGVLLAAERLTGLFETIRARLEERLRTAADAGLCPGGPSSRTVMGGAFR